MKTSQAYPRAFVHRNGGGLWALAWRNHGRDNSWDSPMTLTHYTELGQAWTEANRRVGLVWTVINTGRKS